MGGEEIIEYLRNNYSIKTKKEIINDLNTSWSYIQKLACLNKIKRGFNESKNDHKYSKLIDYNSPITLYWLGFILADGHMWRSQSIHINLSSKDKCHILKLDSYLGGIKKYEISTQIRVAITDKKTCKVLSKDFKLLSNKTKEPPILPDFLTRDQLFCIIIGFIDGDGTISKRGHIRIKCDKSWKFILEMFYEVLTGDRKSFKITNCGCSIIFISKLETLELKI